MAPRLSVAAYPTSVAAATQTAASLPVSFRPATSAAAADVAVIAGDPSWPDHAIEAIAAGSCGIVVSDPGPANAAEVRALADLAEKRAIAVELAEPLCGDPAVVGNRADLHDHFRAVGALFIDERRQHGEPRTLLLSVLRTLRALGQPLPAIRSCRSTPHTVTMVGQADQTMVCALGVITRAARPGQIVRGCGPSRTITVELHGATTAEPARITIADPNGERRLPAIYETAHRAAWKRLHAALAAPAQTEAGPLRELAADLDVVAERGPA